MNMMMMMMDDDDNTLGDKVTIDTCILLYMCIFVCVLKTV